MPDNRRLLVVLAHPDDETFICGGTLARYAQAGVAVTLVCATRGEMGRRMGRPAFANRETLGELREAELRNACAALGVQDLRFLGLFDKTVEFQDEDVLTERVAAVMRELQPGAVLTFHEQLGGHPDHCAIGRATTLAFARCGAAGRLYFLAWRRALAEGKRYGFTESHLTHIDVRRQLPAKWAAFRAHRSQSEVMDWLWKTPVRPGGTFRGRAREETFWQGSGAVRRGETELLPL